MKKMTLAILALVLVTVTTAFTWRNDDAKKEVTTAYFQYQLSTTTGENDEENWEVTQTSGNCLPDGDVLCIIEAPMSEDGIHPDFSGFGLGEDVRTSGLIEYRSYKE